MVWSNDRQKDKSVQYAAFDSEGNSVYPQRRISTTIVGANPKFSINKNMVACVWEDKVALDLTIFSTYIKGKILKNGLDYSNELHIDDGDVIPNDAHRRMPEILWHNDSILYSVWHGYGSLSFAMTSDIYAKKLLLPLPLHRSTPFDTVLNNSWIKVNEVFPTIIKRSSGAGYLAVWVEKDSIGVWKIAGVTCDDSLNPVSSKIDFIVLDTVSSNYVSKPAVFHRNNGSIVIVWKNDTANYQANICFQEFTDQGILIGDIKKVNEKFAGTGSVISADIDSTGRVIIVWEEWPNLIGQRYSSDMNKIGTNFRINTMQASVGDGFPCVKLRNGKIYTAWTRFSNGWPSAWMNILDFDNPTLSVTDENLAIKDYALEQNFPNPFNPTTTISYALPKAGNVVLKVYDILGKEVATLVNDYKQTGRYTVEFDASKLSSGMYICKLVLEKYSAVKKMMVLK